MSPEMLNNKAYSQSTDIWSYAVSVYVLLYGTLPYTPRVESMDALKRQIVAGKPEPSFARPLTATDAPEALQDATAFVRSIMVRSPAQRLTAVSALLQPFVEATSSSSNASDGNTCQLDAPEYK